MSAERRHLARAPELPGTPTIPAALSSSPAIEIAAADGPAITGDARVLAAEALAVDLRRDADRVEREGVERSRLDRLAACGLHALLGPAELGGGDPAVYRRVAETLAGADGTTWFVWFQHGVACRMLDGSENRPLRERWLSALCSGTVQAGVAFSHLRRPGVTVRAERREGGWALSGPVPWATGFGLLDLLLVAGATGEDDSRVVFGLVPFTSAPGLSVTGRLPLAAMEGSETVAVQLEGLSVADDDAVLVAPWSAWGAQDGWAGANVQPSVFGIATAAASGLSAIDLPSAEAFAATIAACRRAAYDLIDNAPPSERIDERIARRAEASRLAVEVATAYVTASGGAAMLAHNEAQRLARHALFHLVFAQNAAVRAATLRALTPKR